MSFWKTIPAARGTYTENAPLGAVGWFRCGGVAEILFKPADFDDLAQFLGNCPAEVPLTVLGALSNTIVRDGGMPGVVIRLPGAFSTVTPWDNGRIEAGAMAFDARVASLAAEAGIAGLEFFSGIPGTIGGALRMNAGAYGGETKDVLGRGHGPRPPRKYPPSQSGADGHGLPPYRRAREVTSSPMRCSRGMPGDPAISRARIAEIKHSARERRSRSAKKPAARPSPIRRRRRSKKPACRPAPRSGN